MGRNDSAMVRVIRLRRRTVTLAEPFLCRTMGLHWFAHRYIWWRTAIVPLGSFVLWQRLWLVLIRQRQLFIPQCFKLSAAPYNVHGLKALAFLWFMTYQMLCGMKRAQGGYGKYGHKSMANMPSYKSMLSIRMGAFGNWHKTCALALGLGEAWLPPFFVPYVTLGLAQADGMHYIQMQGSQGADC